ncbi:MAG: Ppx/GppA phosphatase family protein [Verrucomicrobiota bacterium]|jgi:exopolyphosphatase/guanosine-5'-triphosphate,3'-diphosphate pyrophosphatase
MKGARRAVIDIGTNSVKLLVADVEGAEVRPVREESRQTRLGQGLYTRQRLQAGPIAKTAAAAAEFAARARDHQAASIRVIATSAARDALNSQELTDAIERSCGLRVEIISGAQEADLVFQGVTSDPALAAMPLVLLDVGGGSTEFIVGQGAHQHFGQSLPLGTVRLLERFPPGDPPTAGELAACRQWLRDFLEKEVQPSLAPVLRQEAGAGQLRLVGTGGTASILGCMEAGLRTFDRERLEGTRLSAERLTWHTERLWGLPLEERKQIPGLPKNRADVILAGAAIYEAVMGQFQLDELRVSTRGLRFGAVMSAPGRR